MKITIQSIKFDATEKLEQYIEKKLSRISKIYENALTADVFLKVVKPESVSNKEAEVKVSAPNVEFFATKTCNTFEEAIDLSVEAIEKQILKYKEKAVKK